MQRTNSELSMASSSAMWQTKIWYVYNKLLLCWSFLSNLKYCPGAMKGHCSSAMCSGIPWTSVLIMSRFVTMFQCPFICHLLYLLTRKESGKSKSDYTQDMIHSITAIIFWALFFFSFIPLPTVVRVFRVRKLLDLQSKLVSILLNWCPHEPFRKTALSYLYLIPNYLLFLYAALFGGFQRIHFEYVDILCFSGKAAIPPSPTVHLQSVLPWTGDSLYSSSNEGLYMSYNMYNIYFWPPSYKNRRVCFVVLQSGFRNHNSPWKSALIGVQKRNGAQVAPNISLTITNPRKRVWKLIEAVS